jgi:hypothetical protein
MVQRDLSIISSTSYTIYCYHSFNGTQLDARRDAAQCHCHIMPRLKGLRWFLKLSG